jgi:hypothetical protein
MLKENHFNNETLLNRICDIYGFTQKLQLANHFNIAASSLQNRYKRGNISYDFAVLCALETGARLNWLMTGEGSKFEQDNTVVTANLNLQLFNLTEGRLILNGEINLDEKFLSKPIIQGMALRHDSHIYILEKQSSLVDGLWLVDVDSTNSLREIALLPGKKLYVSGGKIPFECEFDAINLIGRSVGNFCEVS